ncbi:ATP-binding protein [Salinimicrobium oceani]|uniref:histidine kinase n=1 Tax=Salinimicrobium oceani TaxID=2722702 RepID=A0ABX1D0Y7_9FLAO|nr:ATP-binding protein [Salinimicrobium oceani]NJW52516.1 GAF domain-containing protein [Salinimicrobium oceani]
MPAGPSTYPDQVNLDNCAKEPIHIIGKTQAHGVLIVCDPSTLKITQAGENSEEFFGLSAAQLLGQELEQLIGEDSAVDLKDRISKEDPNLSLEVNVKQRQFLMLPHLSHGHLILDFEPQDKQQRPYDFQKQLTSILNSFTAARTVEELCDSAAVITKEMYGYHRVMIYRFDEDWNGEVIAEQKEEGMESWLGLHYPATDIPEQSRRLFLKHRVRVITDVNYTPVPIIPEISPVTGEPLDISRSTLRAVSPIHIEYLKNMEVGASLSAAIVVKGKLWGLIACHHKSRKYLDHEQREHCRFLTRILSNELTLHVTKNEISNFELSENIRRQLVVQMKYHKDLFKALNGDTVKFTELISCGGGAMFFKGRWERSGNAPSKEQLENLLNNFIKPQSKSLFLTRNLSSLFPEADAYKSKASGLLSLKIADNKYIFWFKPEVVQIVNWGGNPEQKAFYNEKEKRISPRKSFKKWSEKLTGTSEPWRDMDKNIARSLRENVSHFVLAQQREEITALNKKLVEANKELELFSYGLSHDLRAPIRGMEGFLNILEEDHGQELSEEGIKMLRMSRELTEKMNDLIDNILEYSRLSHTEGIDAKEVDVSELLQEVLQLFNVTKSYPAATIEIEDEIPEMYGDRRMLFQLWANLLNNALKYSATVEEPKLAIGVKEIEDRQVYFVKDNGIGIAPEFRKKIFETFQRAVGSKFKGSGIGLAIVKKIVEKHNGEVWVESSPGKGSEFYFYLDLPKKKLEETI